MRIYYYRVLPLSDRDTVEFAILIMEDVTEQERLSEDIRRMERHLSIVVESTSEIILSTDPEGRILSWNQSAEQISGYTSQEVEGQCFCQFCAPEHQADVRRLFSERKEAKTPQRPEWDLVTKGGKEVPVSWICSPMMDDQGETIGIVAVGRDLTESRKLEAQLLQAEKLAALGVMAGGIAHELRNPLAICSSSAQFLMEEEITPEFRRECAQKVQQGMQRASGIIEHLLKFTRPSQPGDHVKLDLLAVLKETLVLVADQAKIQNIKVRAQLPETPAFVHGDAHLLQQVFMNLFLNAIHAMPTGGQLRVIVETGPPPGQRPGGRHRARHRCGGPGQHLRPVLLEVHRQKGHRLGPAALLCHCQTARRRHRGGQRAGTRQHLHRAIGPQSGLIPEPER